MIFFFFPCSRDLKERREVKVSKAKMAVFPVRYLYFPCLFLLIVFSVIVQLIVCCF